jgi:PEP-CTERM motif
MLRSIYLATLFIGIGLLGYTPARADVVYSLDDTPWGGGPYGTITVAQKDADSVIVTEVLAHATFSSVLSGSALTFTLDESATTVGPALFRTSSFDDGTLFEITPRSTSHTSLSFLLTSVGGAPLSASDFIVTSGNDIFLTTLNIAGHINQIVGASAVPEPATLAILGMGLLGMSVVRKRSC